MTTSFLIDRLKGSIVIGDATRLEPYQARASVEPQVEAFLNRSRDFGNGYEWLYLDGLSFGGHPASLQLCFEAGCFVHASWSVDLPDAQIEGGWPTRAAIDGEVTFVRHILTKNMCVPVGKTDWGEVWSHFDKKADLASNGVRYRRS